MSNIAFSTPNYNNKKKQNWEWSRKILLQNVGGYGKAKFKNHRYLWVFVCGTHFKKILIIENITYVLPPASHWPLLELILYISFMKPENSSQMISPSKFWHFWVSHVKLSLEYWLASSVSIFALLLHKIHTRSKTVFCIIMWSY